MKKLLRILPCLYLVSLTACTYVVRGGNVVPQPVVPLPPVPPYVPSLQGQTTGSGSTRAATYKHSSAPNPGSGTPSTQYSTNTSSSGNEHSGCWAIGTDNKQSVAQASISITPQDLATQFLLGFNLDAGVHTQGGQYKDQFLIACTNKHDTTATATAIARGETSFNFKPADGSSDKLVIKTSSSSAGPAPSASLQLISPAGNTIFNNSFTSGTVATDIIAPGNYLLKGELSVSASNTGHNGVTDGESHYHVELQSLRDLLAATYNNHGADIQVEVLNKVINEEMKRKLLDDNGRYYPCKDGELIKNSDVAKLCEKAADLYLENPAFSTLAGSLRISVDTGGVYPIWLIFGYRVSGNWSIIGTPRLDSGFLVVENPGVSLETADSLIALLASNKEFPKRLSEAISKKASFNVGKILEENAKIVRMPYGDKDKNGKQPYCISADLDHPTILGITTTPSSVVFRARVGLKMTLAGSDACEPTKAVTDSTSFKQAVSLDTRKAIVKNLTAKLDQLKAQGTVESTEVKSPRMMIENMDLQIAHPEGTATSIESMKQALQGLLEP